MFTVMLDKPVSLVQIRDFESGKCKNASIISHAYMLDYKKGPLLHEEYRCLIGDVLCYIFQTTSLDFVNWNE